MELYYALDDYRYAILHQTPRTQGWYLEKLSRFVAWCAAQGVQTVDQITAPAIRRFLAAMQERRNAHTGQPISTFTLHGYAQVVKGFLNWCAKEELISEKLPKRIEMPRVEQKVIETFSPDQIKRLFAACATAPTPALLARDRAILSLLLDTGIRASELCHLMLTGVFLTPADAFIRVQGKGRKEREIGLGNEARAALHRYLTRYRKAPKAEQHVFLTRSQTPLGLTGLASMIRHLRDVGKVKGVRCSPHTFRHTFAVNYLQAGGDIYRLSRLLGHTSVQVTEQYLKDFKAREARKSGLSVLDTLGMRP
jgi:site-specific recombinase XerD